MPLLLGLLAVWVPVTSAHDLPGVPGANSTYNGGPWPPNDNPAWQPVLANPALPPECGLDVAVLIDRSSSITPALAPQYVAAANALVDGLAESPSRVGIWSFGTNSSATSTATYPSTGGLVDVTNPAGLNTVKQTIGNIPFGSGVQWTNYEAGLQAVDVGTPDGVDLVVFITDGQPTAHGALGGTTNTGNANSSRNIDVDGGLVSGNALKNGGSRILGIGIGDGVEPGSVAEKILQLVTGPTIYNGTNIASADYMLTSFEDAAAALGELSKSLCEATVTVDKRASGPYSPNSYGPDTRADGWGFSSESDAGAELISPASGSGTTGADGTGLLEFTYRVPLGGEVTITEDLQDGFTLQNIICTDAAVSQVGERTGDSVTIDGIQPTDEINCVFENQPVFIDLWVDKDDGLAGGPAVPGEPITYTINYGNHADTTATATDVVLTETVPEYTKFVPAGSGAWVCENGGVAGSTCTLPVSDLAPGQDGSTTFVVDVDPNVPAGATELENLVSVAGTGHERNPNDNHYDEITPLDAAPELTVGKDADVSVVEPGGTIVYSIGYANVGNRDATGVVLTETVPEHTTFVASESGPWNCAGVSAGSVCTLDVGGLGAGDSDSVEFAVQVTDPAPAGVDQIHNLVTITDDICEGPCDEDGEQTPIEFPGTPIEPGGNPNSEVLDNVANLGEVLASEALAGEVLSSGLALDSPPDGAVLAGQQSLPRTGTNIGPLLLAVVLLIVLGTALILNERLQVRRRQA